LRLANRGVIAAEKSLAFAPAATSDKDSFTRSSRSFGHEIRFVHDELRVQPQDCAESAFDLCGSVVVGLEDANGCFDEGAENGDIGVCGETNVKDLLLVRRHTMNHTVVLWIEFA